MRTTPWSVIRKFGFIFCWAIFIVLMWRDHLQDPYDPNFRGPPVYGHNQEGEFLQGFIITLIELGILYMIIRPASFRRSWMRVIGAIALFFPWTLLMIFMTMHGGGILMLHFLWLLVVDLMLIALLMWTLFSIMLNSLTSRYKSD